MEEQDRIKKNRQFGAMGYCLLIFLFIIFINSIGLYGLKFGASVIISWATGAILWIIRILFQSGDDPEGVDKPFGWHLFLLFPLFIPLALPLWLIPVILVISYLISITAFGGYGKHIFNPVIVAVVFMLYGYGEIGITEASRPFPTNKDGYIVWTSGIPPSADIRDVYSSFPQKSVIYASIKGLIPSIPGSCYGFTILIGSLIFALVFNRGKQWWLISVISILIFSYLLPQPKGFELSGINPLILGIIPSLILCGIADIHTLPKSNTGQTISAVTFAIFTMLMYFYSNNILAPAYGFLLAQVFSPLIIDIVGVKNE